MISRFAVPPFALLAAAIGVGCAQGPAPWLVVAASSAAVQPALKAKARLAAAWPEATVVASADCLNLRAGLYLTVAKTALTRSDAQAALLKLTSAVPDAYVRECSAKPDSRIALGAPLVDPSISEVPDDAVNWTDRDRISSVTKLAGGGYLWIRRRYEARPEDPREGRRESVLFFNSTPGNAVQLDPDCTDSTFARLGQWLALSCARETAADHLFHELKVYDLTSSAAVFSARRCRNPKFVSNSALSCDEESVSPAGELRLTPRRLTIAR
jgi:hypothetical protein